MSKRSLYFFSFVVLGFSPSLASIIRDQTTGDVTIQSSDSSSQGKIIFISGSCSSGKSSIAKELTQKLNAKSFAFDERVMPKVLERFIVKHYGKFLAFFINGFVMRNFFTSVDFFGEKKRYEFQKKFYNDLREGLAFEPTSMMYREAMTVASRGQNVVVESPLFLWEDIDCLKSLDEFKGADITYVLAYCPWDDLIDRLKQRNSSKNKKVHRELDWVVINFMHCFNIRPDCHGENYLERLNGSNVSKIVTEYSQAHYKKKRLHLLTETQHIASQKFPQDVGYYVYPRFNYNLTVNTKIHTPEQSAQLILDHIKPQAAHAKNEDIVSA